MDVKDVNILIKILEHEGHPELAKLLNGSQSEVDQSSQFGSRWNSVISTFLIFAPVEQYYKLKKLSAEEKEIIHKSILDIYPITDESPEIISTEFRILRDEPEMKNLPPSRVGRTSRVFISYSSEDKILAGKVKRGLEKYGLEVFLAHEDIDPAAEWQGVILDNLESTDIFLPIVTDKFHASFWTDQESGMAFTKNKLIVPISVNGHNPYGFLARYQALKLDPEQKVISCSAIVSAIIKARPQLESPILDSLIKSFAGSDSFDEAGGKAKLFSEFENMSDAQINEIFKAAIQNGQIRGSFVADRILRALFEKNKDRIDPVIKKDFESIPL